VMVRPNDEKRHAARIRFGLGGPLTVRYKCLSHLERFRCDQVFSGGILNLSKGGMLLVGGLPSPEWLPRLGEGLVLLGLNVLIPSGRPIKALASLRWARPAAVDPAQAASLGAGPHYELGVHFEQLDPDQRTALEKFLIGHQLRTRRIRPLDELGRGSM